MIFKSLKNSPLFFGGLATALAVCMAPAAQAQPAQPAQEFVTVSGSAAYLQRIAMPPNAVLTVRVEDISRADAKAPVLAETREVFGKRQVPLPYSVQVPRAAIDPRMRYAVRASISIGRDMRFTTTRQYPVLTHGAPSQVDLVLAAVPEADQPAHGPASQSPAQTPSPATPAQAIRLALPATFAGVLPCADCMGIAHTLTLQLDGSYRLRRTYLGKPGEPVAEAGRWTADQHGRRVALRSDSGSADSAVFFSVRPDGALRLLDRSGQAFKSQANLTLSRTARIDPVNEAASARPGAGAAAGPATATLDNTYWKLVELNGQPVAMLPGQEREVRITLASEGRRLSGFSGCNALGGSYALSGASLKFDQLASSMRMCEPAANALERQVLDALIATTGQRLDGQRLSLLAGNRVLARFEAVYLK